MMAMQESLERQAKAIEQEVFARYESLFGTVERDSSVRVARDRAIVSAVSELARGWGWLGVIVVRNDAYLWAMSAARDQISQRAIERGRGRAAILREFAGILFDAIDRSGVTVSSVDRYWFVAAAIHNLLLHPWWLAQYGMQNQTAYYKRFSAQSEQTVIRLREAERVARIQSAYSRPVSYPGCGLPNYSTR